LLRTGRRGRRDASRRGEWGDLAALAGRIASHLRPVQSDRVRALAETRSLEANELAGDIFTARIGDDVAAPGGGLRTNSERGCSGTIPRLDTMPRRADHSA